MFEHRQQPLVSMAVFRRRLARSSLAFLLLIGASLAFGTAGYHWVAGLPWLDALLNAAMILTGMGPVDRMESPGAKIFASGYALFSAVAFLTSVGVLIAPVFHRLMHRFHLEGGEGANDER